ncbi:MAG: glycosyltransferase family 4 protein [Actinobacteria bacterium]|nr:glycosyltransferase family 4 protein [Actinomycetota bacterium]
MALNDDGEVISKLRIAMVCPYSLDVAGGVQSQVLGLSRLLQDKGHFVALLAPGAKSDQDQEPRGVYAPILDELGKNGRVEFFGRTVKVPANGSVAPVSLSLKASKKLLTILHDGNFDVVHFHEPLVPGPTLIAFWRSGLPTIATFHRCGVSLAYRFLGIFARFMLHDSNIYVAVSQHASDTAHTIVGVDCRIAFNAVDVDQFNGESHVKLPLLLQTPLNGDKSDNQPGKTRRNSILFLGRHEQRKGLEYLLEAFDILTDTYSWSVETEVYKEPELWIAGEGPQTLKLQQRYQHNRAIKWLGVIDEREKVECLLRAKVVCVPSLHGESFGLVLLEALAAGALVVASDIPAYREVLGGYGVYVPPKDTHKLVGALREALKTEKAAGLEETTESKLQPAKAYVEKFSFNALSNYYADLYERLLGL